jgi:DNA-binding CsgD family transcriptional regulator
MIIFQSRNILFNNTKDDIIKLYKSGLSPLEIISKLNLKKGVVYKHIRNYNNNIKK